MRGRNRGRVLGNPREGVLSGLNFRRHKYSLKLENSDYGAENSNGNGGIHLGSDRWKHINNSLRTILDEQGQIKRKK